MDASYRIELTRSAERELRKVPPGVRSRFASAIERLQDDPRTPRPGVDVRRLAGLRHTFRLRVGEYRGIYEIEGRTVVFTRFGHRSKVYDV